MDGKAKVKVIEVKERPAKLELDGYVMISRGIRTKEAVEKWALHYGFTTVYWLKKDEKVYGVRTAISDQQLAVSQTEMGS